MKSTTLLFLVALLACGDDDSGVADAGFDVAPDVPVDVPVDVPPDVIPDVPPDVPYVDVTLYEMLSDDDATLVSEVERILKGTDDEPGCATCHGMTLRRIEDWGATTVAGLDCIGDRDPNFDSTELLGCFIEGGDAQPSTMGFLSGALHLPWFSLAMERGLEDAEANAYLGRASMPKPPVAQLDQRDIDVLLTWAVRGLPLAEDVFGGGGTECTPNITDEVADHVTTMETEGWAVLNRDAGLAMFGCDADGCLTDFPLTRDTEYGAEWEESGDLRVLFEYTYSSAFWTRSSADGRFVSHGGGEVEDSSIIDLERGVVVGARAFYDPGFFPDNSGFVLQGAGGFGGGGFCSQDVLLDDPSVITFSEAGCTVLDTVGLYQHMAAVQGGDYWAIFGQFVSDNGGHDPVTEPHPAEFGGRSRISLVPIIHEGDRYTTRSEISIPAPFEGDSVLSPSGRLVLSRLRGPSSTQSGFVLRSLKAVPAGDSYDVEMNEVARYCIRGSKVGFSFDERWVTFHRYVTAGDAAEYGYTGADDPAFAEYLTDGAADVFVMDILTGDTQRITRMGPGQYALFPHFRSDGWLYFIVRDALGASAVERVVASDYILP